MSEVISFDFGEKRGRGGAHFGRGKDMRARLLVPTQRCVAAIGSRSRTASGLT
jgi:hypothetical protein